MAVANEFVSTVVKAAVAAGLLGPRSGARDFGIPALDAEAVPVVPGFAPRDPSPHGPRDAEHGPRGPTPGTATPAVPEPRSDGDAGGGAQFAQQPPAVQLPDDPAGSPKPGKNSVDSRTGQPEGAEEENGGPLQGANDWPQTVLKHAASQSLWQRARLHSRVHDAKSLSSPYRDRTVWWCLGAFFGLIWSDALASSPLALAGLAGALGYATSVLLDLPTYLAVRRDGRRGHHGHT